MTPLGRLADMPVSMLALLVSALALFGLLLAGASGASWLASSLALAALLLAGSWAGWTAKEMK